MFPARSHNFAVQLLTYVDAHLDEPITLTDLATRMQMTTSSYCHSFHRATGQSPMQMVRELRLTRAQELLRTTEQTITQISLEVGYRWATHFCKAFRHYTGLSPETYRWQHQAQQSFDTLPLVCALWHRVGPETQAAVLALLQGATPIRPAPEHAARAAQRFHEGPKSPHARCQPLTAS